MIEFQGKLGIFQIDPQTVRRTYRGQSGTTIIVTAAQSASGNPCDAYYTTTEPLRTVQTKLKVALP